MTAFPEDVEEIQALMSESYRRAVEATRAAQQALEEMHLLDYAARTADDPEIAAGMQTVREHMAMRKPLPGAQLAEDYVKRARAKRGL